MYCNETEFIIYWRNSSGFCPLNPKGFGKTEDHLFYLTVTGTTFFGSFLEWHLMDDDSTEKNASFLICYGTRKPSLSISQQVR